MNDKNRRCPALPYPEALHKLGAVLQVEELCVVEPGVVAVAHVGRVDLLDEGEGGDDVEGGRVRVDQLPRICHQALVVQQELKCVPSSMPEQSWPFVGFYLNFLSNDKRYLLAFFKKSEFDFG